MNRSGEECVDRASHRRSFSSIWLPLILGLSACHTTRPAAPVVAGPRTDLLHEAREWRMSLGMAEARDRLVEALEARDDGQGYLEKRLAEVKKLPDSEVPADSLATLPRNLRARTGIYLVLGYRQKGGGSAQIIRETVASLRRDGWRAELIPLHDWGTAEEDAKDIQCALEEGLPKVDRAMLVGFSKGGHDWSTWLASQARKLPRSEREKVRLWVQCAGALRGSVIADWGANRETPQAKAFRSHLNSLSKGTRQGCEDLAALGQDPWSARGMPRLGEVLPRVTAVHYVAIPEGRDGSTHKHRLFGLISRTVARQTPWIGPNDGLVETAAEILPPQDNTTEWIVRVKSSHTLLDGTYVRDGSVVAPSYHPPKEGWTRAGDELLWDLMRALPRSVAGW